jgi:hypothetical protein
VIYPLRPKGGILHKGRAKFKQIVKNILRNMGLEVNFGVPEQPRFRTERDIGNNHETPDLPKILLPAPGVRAPAQAPFSI